MDNLASDELPMMPATSSVFGTDFYTPGGWKSEVLDHARALAELTAPSPTLDWLIWDRTIHPGYIKIPTYYASSPNSVELNLAAWHALGHHSIMLLLTAPTAYIRPAPYIEPKQIAFDFDINVVELSSVLGLDQTFNSSYSGQTIFIPTTQLCQIWSEGLSSYIDNSRYAEKILENFEPPEGDDLHDHFASKFQRMIATIANAKSGDVVETIDLSDGIQFTLDFQHAIMDRFFVDPSRQSSFLFQLHIELRDYLAGGGAIQGKWGRAIVEDGRIRLRCNQKVKAKLPAR